MVDLKAALTVVTTDGLSAGSSAALTVETMAGSMAAW
jgi:hypothetical protein